PSTCSTGSPFQLFINNLPRPPRPPRLPYTTLFRSPVLQSAFAEEAADGQVHRMVRGDHVHAPDLDLLFDQPVNDAVVRSGMAVEDRKSTRLNSSHVKISYVVFCLKKKKGNLRMSDY